MPKLALQADHARADRRIDEWHEGLVKCLLEALVEARSLSDEAGLHLETAIGTLGASKAIPADDLRVGCASPRALARYLDHLHRELAALSPRAAAAVGRASAILGADVRGPAAHAVQ